ncbi:SDR family oxidoreductase [Vibrio scophthalmi]|uniref:dTDP-4-dehydrorhamnose reductase n=1 Tax=Vibrio scophthalmi TaxID=45658 RepID=A0A1E3WHB4_9VIBR|nr:NAD(P)-dependent oxidoreductase [Vibrio scophthalmi]ODS04427.1 dTDP-4-dehydrorhamnose reductase [Vibrio scophthalmi]
MKKRILITGANGFFGTRFINQYSHEFDITATDVPDLDITDAAMVNETFAHVRPDYVIHAAAIAVTDFCNANPEIAHKVNVQGAINVAKACKDVGAKLVFISTEQVFNGNTQAGPYDETITPEPDTVYGQNKLEAEVELANIIDELWVLRFTWLFGLPERNTTINPNVLWNALQALLKGERMIERRNEFRGLTYVHELIEQFPKVFEIPYGTYHTGAQNDASRYDIAEHIIAELGLALEQYELLEGIDAPATRDIRLNTQKLADAGVCFTESRQAISKCLKEFSFRL